MFNKPATNEKAGGNQGNMNVLKEDDEFEEFPVEDWQTDQKTVDKFEVEQWNVDWDDEFKGASTGQSGDYHSEFSRQLRAQIAKVHQDLQSTGK